MSRDEEALSCYEEGLKQDPSSDLLKNAANDVRTLMRRQKLVSFFTLDLYSNIILKFLTFSAKGSTNGNPFNSPEALAKLAMHPKTSAYMSDPVFRGMLTQMTQSKDNIGFIFNQNYIHI